MRTTHAVTSFIADCHYRSLSAKTIGAYEWALTKLSTQFSALPMARADIRKLIATQQFSDVSRYDLWLRLKTFYNWLAVEEEWERLKIPNPMARLQAPNLPRSFPRTLTDAEIRDLLASADTRRDRALLAVAIDSGPRLGELTSMVWPNITNAGIIVTGKTGQRSIPLSTSIRQLIIGLGDGHHLWTGLKGPLTQSGVSQAIRRCAYRAGIYPPKAGPHVLRHTFGLNWVLNGGDVFSLQRIMGHRNIQTTMVYINMSNRDLVELHEKYSPLRDHDLLTSSFQLQGRQA